MGIVFFHGERGRDRYKQIIYIFSAMFIPFRKHWEVYGTIENITVVQGI
jgi:hypothetical protein